MPDVIACRKAVGNGAGDQDDKLLGRNGISGGFPAREPVAKIVDIREAPGDGLGTGL